MNVLESYSPALEQGSLLPAMLYRPCPPAGCYLPSPLLFYIAILFSLGGVNLTFLVSKKLLMYSCALEESRIDLFISYLMTFCYSLALSGHVQISGTLTLLWKNDSHLEILACPLRKFLKVKVCSQ